MYLEQFKKDKKSILKYLPFVVGFLGFMALNLLVSVFSKTSTKDEIQNMIEKLGKNTMLFTTLLPFACFLVLLLIWWKYIHNYNFRQLNTSRKKIDYSRFLYSFLIWGTFNAFIIAVTYIIEPHNFELQFNISAFIPLLLISIIFIPLQTSFEEYFFRGYLLQFLAFTSKNKGIAILLSSIIFGLLHINNPEVSAIGGTIMLFYIGSGLLLAIITLMDDGLELALGFHAVNNLFGALVITTNSAVFQTDALFLYKGKTSIVEMLIQVFIIFPILLYIFSKKYNWANWKQKLIN